MGSWTTWRLRARLTRPQREREGKKGINIEAAWPPQRQKSNKLTILGCSLDWPMLVGFKRHSTFFQNLILPPQFFVGLQGRRSKVPFFTHDVPPIQPLSALMLLDLYVRTGAGMTQPSVGQCLSESKVVSLDMMCESPHYSKFVYSQNSTTTARVMMTWRPRHTRTRGRGEDEALAP